METSTLAEIKASSTESELDRFLQNVKQEGDCWVWIGHRSPSNYGRFRMDGKVRRAHRVSYEIFVGAIPSGLVLDHLCRNRPCVNPGHLEAVTTQENTRRAQPFRFRFCPHSTSGTTTKCDDCKPKYRRMRALYIQIGRDLVEVGSVDPAKLAEAKALRSLFPSTEETEVSA